MAISVRQALLEGQVGLGELSAAELSGMGLKPTERLLLEKTLMQLYPRLQCYDLPGWKKLFGPMLSDFWMQCTDSRTRRIVEIGCGDGLLSNLLSLLFPEIEIIGIDSHPGKISDAQATIGYRQNLRFLHAQATVLPEIPCDRIIYNQCLTRYNTNAAFKKLVMKTADWIVDEGDIIIKETPLAWLGHAALIQELAPLLRKTGTVEGGLAEWMALFGLMGSDYYLQVGPMGIPGQLFLRAHKSTLEKPLAIKPFARPVGVSEDVSALAVPPAVDWQDWGAQTNDSLLGFLFSGKTEDFARELRP